MGLPEQGVLPGPDDSAAHGLVSRGGLLGNAAASLGAVLAEQGGRFVVADVARHMPPGLCDQQVVGITAPKILTAAAGEQGILAVEMKLKAVADIGLRMENDGLPIQVKVLGKPIGRIDDMLELGPVDFMRIRP